ncbi:MAG: MOSC domain-containing protein [Acidobacteria bacterium]|nr:MOSC domain-containing protein [Acidobacteriota bacterium]
MAAEPLDQVDVSWFGLAGDRRWAFLRDRVMGSGFPWLTIREVGPMQHYRPKLKDPGKPDGCQIVVQTPGGRVLAVDDPELAAELGPGVCAIKQNRGVFDTFPLSLITTQTISSLSTQVGFDLHVQRFRPNFLVQVDGNEAYPEDAWLGRVLRIGSMRFRVDKRDGRCVVITVDPETSQRQNTILRTVAQERQGCLGVYGTPVEPGMVSLYDRVFLEVWR